MISHVFTPDSILCYVSPRAAQSCCDHRAKGGVFRAAAFPAHTGRAVGAPALLPSILGGSRWRCSHGRQLELWELQAVRWRMPFHCPGENSSWEQLHPKSCKLHFGVTIPKWTVHAVLEERTFIPARVSFGVFYLTWCLNVHHRYCGRESPAALPLTPSSTALLPALCSSCFPPEWPLRCLCAFPCQRVLLREGLWGRRGAAASAFLQPWWVTTQTSYREKGYKWIRTTLRTLGP